MFFFSVSDFHLDDDDDDDDEDDDEDDDNVHDDDDDNVDERLEVCNAVSKNGKFSCG